MSDLIDRQAAIDAIESTDWYHQNRNGEMVHGANSREEQAWYKADEVHAVIENLPSAQHEITLESAIDYLHSIGWLQEHDRVLTESAQPEQKIEELLPDGTLLLSTDADLSKVGRVLISQSGTHYGCLFYADAQSEQKTGRWEPIPSLFGTLGICSVCHNASGNKYEYCPWCGAKMEEGDGN